jgi:predicted ATPase/DNA-binding SARP family transcriptional activator
MDYRLEVLTLGEVRILKEGELVTGFKNRKAIALLIYLASTRRSQSREVLADLLWDERTQDQSLGYLRMVLSNLRKAVGSDLLIGRESLSLNPQRSVWMDSAHLDNCLREVRLQGRVTDQTAHAIAQALALYRGDFLEGFYISKCRRFEDWQLRERERLHHLAIDGLYELVAYQVARMEYQPGLENASRLLELDPLMEAAHRQMMLLLAGVGQRSAALAQYETCQRLLHDELGVDPQEETRDLYEQIRSGQLKTGAEREALPSLYTRVVRTDNLPLRMTSFIGREQEIREVRELISNYRLVTLTGSGGVGKTRLALEVCSGFLQDYEHGVWQVELAPLSEPETVLPAIALVFNLQAQPERSWKQVLLDFLRHKKLLLLLDNCEHLISTCAELAETIVETAAGVSILASSRQALGIQGEAIYPVPSLSLPDADPAAPVAAVQASEAGRLFAERAGMALPGFEISTGNADAVARICWRLDGIPLALELAAARVNLLKVEQIVARLDDAFSILSGGSRTALPRQQTLRSTIEWSYHLLSQQEKTLFRRLAVFRGGWDLEAAERICAGDGAPEEKLAANDILELLSSLVSKSLANVTREPGQEARYRLLETVHQYAREKAMEAGGLEIWRSRHLEYFTAWAEELEPRLRGPEQAYWFERLMVNLENIRLALEWGLERDPQAALRLAAGLHLFWYRTKHMEEGIQWLIAALDRPESAARTVQRGRALLVFGNLWGFYHANFLEQEDSVREGLEICKEQDDPFGQGLAYLLLGKITSSYYKDHARAKDYFDSGLQRYRATGDRWYEGNALLWYAISLRSQGDIVAARINFEKSMQIFEQTGDERTKAVCLAYLTIIIGEHEGDLQKGQALGEQALAILQSYKHDETVLWDLCNLALNSLYQGNFRLAREYCIKIIEDCSRTGNIFLQYTYNGLLGFFLSVQGSFQQAIELLEYSSRKVAEQYPHNQKVTERTNFTILSYCYANLSQIELAKSIIDRLDPTKFINPFHSLYYHWVQSRIAFLEADSNKAARHARDCLSTATQMQYRVGIFLGLESCAGSLFLSKCHAESIKCLAAVHSSRLKSGAPVWPAEQPYHERLRWGLISAVGEGAFQEHWQAGECLSLEEAVELALSLES